MVVSSSLFSSSEISCLPRKRFRAHARGCIETNKTAADVVRPVFGCSRQEEERCLAKQCEQRLAVVPSGETSGALPLAIA